MKTLGAFFSAFNFSKNRFIKKYRSESVFMLQRWFAYQHLAERRRNMSSALDFSFSAMFFFCKKNMKSNNCRKKKDFSFFFLLEGLLKIIQTQFEKKQSWVSLPYAISFILIGESYLYYAKSQTSILFSRVGIFFRKKCEHIEKI